MSGWLGGVDYLARVAAANATFNWQPGGQFPDVVNGVNQTFTLPNTPKGYVPLFINGIENNAAFVRVGNICTHQGAALNAGAVVEYGEFRY